MATPMKRVLKLTTSHGIVDVGIEVFWPEPRQASWFSDWKIQWPNRTRTGSAGGVDAIQAILSALSIVGAEINCSTEGTSGNLTWGDAWIGFGFPVPNGMRDALIGDDAKYL